ncbi:Tetratricopeptide repeat family protein [Borrelia coriaceae ATCC 43381]|uniref:Tetratricopeptide repeat family protein n=1 Tax=Borrelia coriaceae ATCC 43381 TaxID=1408429 RepID=W5SUU1_9SPIR|nr:tetratricopeptide repeat protein [Borrelia coriaceae]AHH10428.1 Tetratricopeptide repeat family protein [Borrelia coriaceae ATCC 43381]
MEENPTNQKIDSFKAFLSYGFYNLERNFNVEALGFLKKAYIMKKNDIDVNYYLGIAFLRNGHYKEALHYLTKIYKIDKDNEEALKYIGIALFHTGNYTKAVGIFNNIRKYIQNDIDALLAYAQSLSQLNQDRPAFEIANKIRNKNGMIYEALLIESEINSKNHNLAKLEDNIREMMKIKPDLPKKTLLKLFYKLGELYIEHENYKKATEAFTQVERIDPHYQKIAEKLEFSKRLNENLALRIYLKSPKEKFDSLASAIILQIYKNKFQVRDKKINEINLQFIDMNFQLSNNQWEENLIVRFVRTDQKNFGELFLKDFIAKTKESKLKGLCIAPATFSDKAKQIIEGRLIDLIEGKKLMQILKTLDVSKYI